MSRGKMAERSWWVIEFTSIDGKRYTWHDFAVTRQKFSTEAAAKRWAKTMPDWQQPTIKQLWDAA